MKCIKCGENKHEEENLCKIKNDENLACLNCGDKHLPISKECLEYKAQEKIKYLLAVEAKRTVYETEQMNPNSRFNKKPKNLNSNNPTRPIILNTRKHFPTLGKTNGTDPESHFIQQSPFSTQNYKEKLAQNILPTKNKQVAINQQKEKEKTDKLRKAHQEILITNNGRLQEPSTSIMEFLKDLRENNKNMNYAEDKKTETLNLQGALKQFTIVVEELTLTNNEEIQIKEKDIAIQVLNHLLKILKNAGNQ